MTGRVDLVRSLHDGLNLFKIINVEMPEYRSYFLLRDQGVDATTREPCFDLRILIQRILDRIRNLLILTKYDRPLQ